MQIPSRKLLPTTNVGDSTKRKRFRSRIFLLVVRTARTAFLNGYSGAGIARWGGIDRLKTKHLVLSSFFLPLFVSLMTIMMLPMVSVIFRMTSKLIFPMGPPYHLKRDFVICCRRIRILEPRPSVLMNSTVLTISWKVLRF